MWYIKKRKNEKKVELKVATYLNKINLMPKTYTMMVKKTKFLKRKKIRRRNGNLWNIKKKGES